MGKVFEVGKMYCRAESGFDPQKIIRRTEKTIVSCNAYGDDAYGGESHTFRQRIHVDEDGTEWVHDSGVPERHRDSTVCKASWEVKE